MQRLKDRRYWFRVVIQTAYGISTRETANKQSVIVFVYVFVEKILNGQKHNAGTIPAFVFTGRSLFILLSSVEASMRPMISPTMHISSVDNEGKTHYRGTENAERRIGIVLAN